MLCLCLGTWHGSARGSNGFEITAALGAAFNFDSRLEIAQTGQPQLDIAASYETRAFEFPLYYALRLAWGRDHHRIELQLVHHKVHLVGAPPEIQQFEISHGFNLLSANYASRAWPIVLRAGLGLVVAHPESVVRGLAWERSGGVFDSGYQVTGPAFVAGAGYGWDLGRRWSVVPEVFLSVARARVQVADGSASLVNVALHGLLGLRFAF